MSKRFHALTILIVLGLATLATAQTFNTLYNFTGGSDGGTPFAGVIQDSSGTLYGTTFRGGNNGCFRGTAQCGVVYKLDTTETETALYSFSGSDGAGPIGPLVRDMDGNLYGTTAYGGRNDYGTVFKIDTAGNHTVLHKFTGGADGCSPEQGLIISKSGGLFGTTYGCGANRGGTIFKINRAGKFTVLHTFTGGSADGAGPAYGHLKMDRFGNLYGVTSNGGAHDGVGVVYELNKDGTFTVLYSFVFNYGDGWYPDGSVAMDKFGNLYGTTLSGGSATCGTIWKVSKKGKETILHTFGLSSSDGCSPFGGVVRDPKGNLYGVTDGGGATGAGALYQLSPKGEFTLLCSFGSGSDGTYPVGEVLRTASGTLFGTTAGGGIGDCKGDTCGTVWSYVP
jgi:uncharacterized repeat protein (TIGR03803 family)